jgi:hypothetical protein
VSESTSAPWALNYRGLSNPNGLATYLDQVSQLRGLFGRDGQPIQAAPASGPGIWNWNNPVGTSALPAAPPAPAIPSEGGAAYSPDYVPGMTSPDTPQAHIIQAAAEGAKAGFGPVPGWQDVVYRPATTVIEAPFKVGGALFGGAQGVIHQGARELGAPETLARDLAALPESFGPEAPHLARNAPSALTPLAAGVTDALSDTRGGGPNPLKAYHGTPHRFEPTEDNPLGRFDLSKIGSGEGAQVYGHGAYLAENESIARHYRDALSPPAEPTLDFTASGGPKGFNQANAREAARDFTLEHPDTEVHDERSVGIGSDYAVDQFFDGRTRQEAHDAFRPGRTIDAAAARAGIDAAYDWLADAKLDPGGPKVGDEPYKADDDTHKAAWYVDRANGDPKRAIDELDAQQTNMEAMQRSGRGPNGVIAPNFYAGAIARAKRIKEIIQQQGDELPKYAEPDRGHMYEADIQAHPEHMLHWDKPLSQQSPYVRQRLSDLGYALPQHDAGKFEWRPGGHPADSVLYHSDDPQRRFAHIVSSPTAHHVYGANGQYVGAGMTLDAAKKMAEDRFAVRPAPPKEMTGEEIYHDLAKRVGKIPEEPGGWGSVPGGTVQQYGTNPAKASEMLREAGIPALRYFDANSRRQGLTLPKQIADAQAEVARHSADLINYEAKRESLPRGSKEWSENEIKILNADMARSEANRRLAQHRKAHNDLRHNFVIFDPSTVNIIRRYGLAGVLGGGAAAAAGGPQSE